MNAEVVIPLKLARGYWGWRSDYFKGCCRVIDWR